jgi:predicted protein tyrosine phosphatase
MNHNRSPFAAEWFKETCAQRGLKHEARSAGLDVRLDASWATPVTPSLLEWTDKVVVMEEYMRDELHERFSNVPPIYILQIPDFVSVYNYDDTQSDRSIEFFYQEQGQPLRRSTILLKDITKTSAIALYHQYGLHARIGPAFFRRILECHLESILE